MKLFKQLLVAPAALGLAAPLAVSAQEMASLNGMAAVNEDMNQQDVDRFRAWESKNQVTSVNQFSDVRPTDWAYQALSNLIERYGCVAGYPNGTFKGGNPLNRYEAAALLNACLERITEQTDEVQRLLNEFHQELTVLRGRVDGLEARLGELEATQFSTTTKLRGRATFVVGANSFTGSSASVDAIKATIGATTFNYDVRLNLDSSFTGKDLLRTTLRADNFYGNGITPNAYAQGLTFLEVATNAPTANNVLEVNRLFYNFPVGKNFSVTAGARVRMDDAGMLGMWPSVYPADTVLDFFTYAGAPGAYNARYGLGAGAGIVYQNVLGAKGWTLSTSYVSANGDNGNPSQGGIMTDGSSSTSLTQVGYRGGKFPVIGGSAWGLAAAYAYSQNMPLPIGTGLAADFAGNTGTTNNVGISGYWVPENTGWIPSISTGWGVSAFQDNFWQSQRWAQANSWYLGLQWADTFVKGNDLGMAVGQAPFITNTGNGGFADFVGNFADRTNTPLDSNYMWEFWYKVQVTDNITVTPALYYITNYQGMAGRVTSSGSYDGTNNVFGGLLKTTFKF